MDADELVAECLEAIVESDPRLAMRDVLDRALADGELGDTLGVPTAGLNPLYRAHDLTVLNVVWPPFVSLFPHDHRMWAAIGIYRGREDNAFYRRDGSRIVATGGKELSAGDVLLLGTDAVHAVHNPVREYTGAIHVYGGDFFDTPRSQWDSTTREEAPYDLDAVRRQFEEAEARYHAAPH
jgi:predicted metal-dependent enzyme (double-stranded beta helix superfamily)